MTRLVRPSYVPDPKNLPSPEQPQQVSIRPGSRLAILGIFVELIRRRYSAGTVDPTFQWRWDKDPNVATIEVESAFNEDKSAKNRRPAIYVDADEQVTGRTVLGDFAGRQHVTGLTGFWHLQTVPILIECVAAKKAESAVLADVTGVFLQASNRLIQAKFGFHDMGPVTISRTQPYPTDKACHVTAVTFSVQCDLRYTNAPTAPLLEQVEADLLSSGAESSTAFFETIALDRSSKG